MTSASSVAGTTLTVDDTTGVEAGDFLVLPLIMFNYLQVFMLSL